MGRKNSGELASTDRPHRHPKSTGKPSGRGFTGHRGRGRGRSFGGHDYADPEGTVERPESVVDDQDQGEDNNDDSSGMYQAAIGTC